MLLNNSTYPVLALLLFLFFGILWWRQIQIKNANAVDAAWSLSFVLVAVAGLLHFWGKVPSWRLLLVGSLIAFWSLRLGIFLLRTRVWSGKPEDSRYRRLRESLGWGQAAFFVIYQMQAILVLILTPPLWIAMSAGAESFGFWDFVGVLVFSLSIFGESLADRQLEIFKQDPRNRGRTCQEGLWRYSRHPNYFFEWLHWCSYVFFALGSEAFVWTLLAPTVMWFFLTKLTGIPAAERQALRSRVDYENYQKTTSAFFPWFRKRT
jgi:steroid 5-alpha reductase family enzyme